MRILKPLPGILPMPGHPLADPIGFWLMNSLGNKAFDSSGNGNEGIFGAGAASPSWIAGKFGYALDFGGDGDYVDIGTKSNLISVDGTIVFWFKGTGDNGESIFSLSSDDDNFHFFTIVVGNNVTSTILNELIILAENHGNDHNRIAYVTTTRTELFDGNWHQVAITGGTNYKIYLDGISKTITVGATGLDNGTWTDNGMLPPEFGRLGITSINAGDLWPLEGSLDHVLLYNRALSASEIALLYREPFCMFPENIMPEFGIAA